jgi:hypothetical protein
MRKVFLLALVLVILFLFSTGCATRDYVRQQMEPLVERISKLETQCSSRGPSQGAVEAEKLAQEAMKTAKDCCGKGEAAAERAEAAAERAEAAAKKAAAAAETSKKAFELQQMK